jgi:hypothetical protein
LALRRQPDRRYIRLLHSVAKARIPIRCGLARTSNGLKVDDGVVAKYLGLRHDIKVVAVPVFIGASNLGTPLLVAIVRAEVRDHDNNAFAANAANAAAGHAGRIPC